MKNISRILFTAVLFFALVGSVNADKVPEHLLKKTKKLKATSADCSAGSSFQFLEVNNVRARINTGGDMWWDLAGLSQYFIPANTKKTALFAGALWIGGMDINNQLKLCAQRFRQVGIDFYPGPLTIDGTASVTPEVCSEYDRFYITTKPEVEEFIGWFNSTNRDEEYPDYVIPTSIRDWPGNAVGLPNSYSYYLAPYYDNDGDETYNPDAGDYPYYDLDNVLCPINYAGDPNWKPQTTADDIHGYVKGGILSDQVLKGDQTLWWVFNDKGGPHTETKGDAIGLEIRAQSFAFTTNDEINNMTFYSYEIINRSTFVLTQTYFSPWTDADLGYARDDYVGCDVLRGMGYAYNGAAIDGSGEPESYGTQPPAVGIDFFQGPYLDPDGSDNPGFVSKDSLKGPTFAGNCDIVGFNGTDITMFFGKNKDTSGIFKVRSEAINGVNFGNGIVDDERYGMRRFVYHNNDNSIQGDPDIAPDYYNYLRGIWGDGTKMLYGGNGHINSGAVGPECDFMFPGDSDSCNWGTQGIPPNGGYNVEVYWTEEQAGNQPADRRFMQSAGPFTLQPGAVNYITFGIPWARATSGGPMASVQLLRTVDDKCQALFENCFKVIDGPDAPDLSFQELDREIIVYVDNSKGSNNYKESYSEWDNTIQGGDSLYRFQGYQIYQLLDNTVSVDELSNPAKARLVKQMDIKDTVVRLINFNLDRNLGYSVPVEMVNGANGGISHSFTVTKNMFPTGADDQLVNYQHYYYMALSYAYNKYADYDPNNPLMLNGQKKPYLAGRKNIRLYTVLPHPTINGTVMNSMYGTQPSITRVQGQGNGGNIVNLSEEAKAEILSKGPASEENIYGGLDYPIAYKLKYELGSAPINVKVIDPLKVVSRDFTLSFIDGVVDSNRYEIPWISTSKWELKDNTGNVWISDTTIDVRYEQLIPDIGLSVDIQQIYEPGDSLVWIEGGNNGFLTSFYTYPDYTYWLSGVQDNDIPRSALNWIRSGSYTEGSDDSYNAETADWRLTKSGGRAWDPGSRYEQVLEGTWAPYCMTAYYDMMSAGGYGQNRYAPAMSASSKLKDSLLRLSSVDVTFTSDKSLWTRCPVVEMGWDIPLNEGEHTYRFMLRDAPSVDKDGNFAEEGDTIPSTNSNDADYIATRGMGWFPGYAINIETGERMNMMFGENSWLSAQNGRDMLFNPTSQVTNDNGDFVLGGMHYVYVMGHRTINNAGFEYKFNAWDDGKSLLMPFEHADTVFSTLPESKWAQFINGALLSVYANTLWTGLPIPAEGYEDMWLSTDVTASIRVAKPYNRFYSVALDSTSQDTLNDNFPVYTFSTEGLQVMEDVANKVETDLDLINVIPNPYYAYSPYENNPTDNRIRINNLPEECVVTIYNVGGSMVRQYTKAEMTPYIDWDLKNFANIPIAGGVYYIHVKSDDGERVIKWFGVIRTVDLFTF